MKLNTRTLLLLFTLFSFAISSCGAGEKSQSQLKDEFFEKMVGVWYYEKQSILEKWYKNNSGNYAAKIYYIEGVAEPILQERSRIIESSVAIVMETTILAEGIDVQKTYRMVEVGPNKIKFSRDAKQFPQHIEYQIEDNDNLVAFVSGEISGGFQEFALNYVKIDEAAVEAEKNAKYKYKAGPQN